MNDKQKKLLLLGGSSYLRPVIREAHALGIHVITCDYLPDNAAHKLSDQYLNISILDKDAVLEAARELQIDGDELCLRSRRRDGGLCGRRAWPSLPRLL